MKTKRHRLEMQAIGLAAALVLMAATGVRTEARAGQSDLERLRQDVRSYHALVLGYRQGQASVESLLQWDEKRLHRALGAIDSAADETRPWTAARFKAAVMLHTDAALQLLDGADDETAAVHLDSAGQLLTRAGPALQPYAGSWHQATARVLRDRRHLPSATQLLAWGRDRFPRDPAILYESGALEEWRAADIQADRQTGPVDPPEALRPEHVDRFIRDRARRLDQAAAWFRQSLEAAPANVMARLHLGRVLSLRGHGDARRFLEEAAAAEAPGVAYLALLFTAGLHDRHGRLDEAAQAYRAAIERWPFNHSAYIGLSAVLQRTGRLDESRDVLRVLLRTSVRDRSEPWWFYLADPPSLTLTRLDELRREARE